MTQLTLTLSSAQSELIDAYLEAGRYGSADAVIEAALALLRRHEPPTKPADAGDDADINDYLAAFEAPE